MSTPRDWTGRYTLLCDGVVVATLDLARDGRRWVARTEDAGVTRHRARAPHHALSAALCAIAPGIRVRPLRAPYDGWRLRFEGRRAPWETDDTQETAPSSGNSRGHRDGEVMRHE